MGIITGMRIPRGSSRRAGVSAGLVVIVMVLASVLTPVAQEPQRCAAADWPMYNRDLAGVSGSPMTCMHDGAQYIMTAVSGGGHVGELLAYRLVD